MVIQEPVQAVVWQCLNHYAYSDATFLAERLYAEVKSDDALFLLATCYYRAGKPTQTYTLLKNKGCASTQLRFLMAQCCLDINKLSEAEAVLSGNILRPKSMEDMIAEFGDMACFALSLLAKVYSKTERNSKASENYRRSLKLNPFLWTAFESLCLMGEKPDPNKTFAISQHNVTTMCPTSNNYSTPTINTSSCPSNTPSCNMDTPVEKTPMCIPSIQLDTPGSGFLGTSLLVNALSPSFGVLPLEMTPSPVGVGSSKHTPVLNLIESMSIEPKAPLKKPMTRRSQQQHNIPKPPVFSQSGNTNTNTIRDVQTPSPQAGIPSSNIGGLRRSSRLFSASSSSVKENSQGSSKAPNPRKFQSPKAPVKKSKTKTRSAQELNEINKTETENKCEKSDSKTGNSTTQAQVLQAQKQSAEGLMSLLQEMGCAYQALCQFECTRAVDMLQALPPHHYNSGWVLGQIGRAYFEMAEYQKSVQLFSEMRQLEPHHLGSMEYYSTALWHLEREVQLSTLAQQLTSIDRDSPQAWCATGNCFSLQKEHDTAIKFFQRAVQVCPNFAYAYTLLGHEYVATEELEKALACFRNAIRVDPRHYNAWYGLGMVYYRQEKLSLAEIHFRKALSINPQSSVLLCHIGVVQHALKKSDRALQTFERAIAADPKNALCKFHRASILFAGDKHQEALTELEELKEIVPRESLVYFLIGKVHKKLGNTHLALMNFSWAMDLDPKGTNNHIKEAIDKRYVTDDEDPGAAAPDTGGFEDAGMGSSNNSSLMDADDVQLHAMESDDSL